MKDLELLTYPIILRPEEKGMYLVNIPDIGNEDGLWTEGTDLANAIFMASDAIGCVLYDAVDYPKSSKLEDIKTVKNEIKTVVSVNMREYRHRNSKKIRKEVLVPDYLVDLGKKKQLDLSQVLTDALEAKLE
ncbi:HicB family protein [Lactobacillus sp. ESL0791]|uniref:type II toxin-antitoxin system HicB family antitoxin n=1 Tax=Lactobacillus sp. ESL0791 TaxID=2983234 RepID=UPI0023F7A37E|nr:HicB family protein [Lactobacillus sp. ESL0791]MDF7638522.1 HicB family protein [Lactobacillus sp. ESL0791]